ncbi:MAG: hypothetical protein ABJO30_06260 [Hyphomicrobiales bacterium]
MGIFFRLILLVYICFAPPTIFAHILFGGYFSRISLLITLFISGIGLLIFSRLATYLPAYIAGIYPSINSAFQRGKDNWKNIFGSLLLLNIIIFVTTQIYSKGILGLAKQFMTAHPEIVATKGNDAALLPIAGFSLILTIPVFLILGYSVACGAVILSHAYLRDPSVRLDYNADA